MMVHPNIVKLYNYTENDFGIFLHMEYCNDPNFFVDNLEASMKPFDDEKTLRWYAWNILDGLHYIHESNIIHGDMKI